MKKSLKLLTGLGLVIAGLSILSSSRSKSESKQMLTQVAEEGYETAIDILFPEKETRGKKLHYGPVLPA